MEHMIPEQRAPADAAGHLGSETVPQDVSTSSPPALDDGDGPIPTNQDTTDRGSPPGGWLLPIALTLVFLALVVAFGRI